MEHSISQEKVKPVSLKAIIYLNAFKILLSLGFFTVFTIKEIQLGNVGPELILYTTAGYTLMFIAILFFINNRNLWGLRIAIALDFAISIPATAFIGLTISFVSLLITFLSKAARDYFQKN